MKSSEILRKAARLIESEEFNVGCDAIAGAAQRPNGYMPPERVMKWFRLVGPGDAGFGAAWWGNLGNSSYRNSMNRSARIIGLCLAAAIAESEGD